ncbi:hypothetical protein [Ruminococcus sp.]|nr:hypothetical protein [Ruminococcus sp.]
MDHLLFGLRISNHGCTGTGDLLTIDAGKNDVTDLSASVAK